MSRKVDLSKPLSEKDRKYLEDRNMFHAIAEADGTTPEEAIQNVNQFGTSAGRSPVEAIDADADAKGGRQSASAEMTAEEWVDSLTVPQLKEEIKKLDPEASTEGKKAELQDQLLLLLPEADEEEDV